MTSRVRYATRAELITLLGYDEEERAMLEIVFDRLADHGVDVDALVQVSVELVGEQHTEKPSSLTPVKRAV